MTRKLLVSVRDADEAGEAVAGGADVIDVKDPSAGPLGAAAPETVLEIARVIRDTSPATPWTIACGELVDRGGSAIAAAVADMVVSLPKDAPRPWLVKTGLSAAEGTAWEASLADLASRLPPGVGQAAVAYADWESCGAPSPAAVSAAAARLGIGTVLVDTFDKRAGGLFAILSEQSVADLRAATRTSGAMLALAGRLRIEDADAVARIAPEIVAVRSVVCEGGRLGRVAREGVRRAASTLCGVPGRGGPVGFRGRPDGALMNG